MIGSFHTPNHPEWSQALEKCRHDMYHLPGFASVEAEWEGAEPEAFIVEGGDGTMLIPLLLRPTRSGTGMDAVTPYGYSGPVFSPECSLSFRGAALAAFDASARDRRLVSTFMRLHPLLEPSLAPILAEAGLEWREVSHGETVTLPLEPDSDDWLSGLGKQLRYDIRRLHRLGYAFELDTEEAWSAFPSIYQETMDRVGAGVRYHYTDEYLGKFRVALGDSLHCGMIRAPHGEPAASALFSHVGSSVQYHLSGARGDFQKAGPTKLLLAEMRNHARSIGARTFHLGGGEGSTSDSLFKFKARFGGRPQTFRTVRAIHDSGAFQKECQAWLDRTGEDSLDGVSFFPPYRAPVPESVSAE